MADNGYFTSTAIRNPGQGELAEYIHLEPFFICAEAAAQAAAAVGGDVIQVQDEMGLAAIADRNGNIVRRYI